MSDEIQTSSADGVFTITVNRAAAGNRLTNPMAVALASALDHAGSARVIVLRANGPDFCLGREIEPPAAGAGVNALDVLRDDAGPIVALYEALRRREQPLIGLVAGKAWGIGLVLAAVCDLTIAAEESSFRLRELDRGIPPCIAMAPLLDRMPVKALAHLVYTAEEMNAAWALGVGLVSQVVAAQQLEEQGRIAAARLVGFPSESVKAVKQFLASAPGMNEPNAVLYGASLLGNVLGSR
jgi:enoyl-CoA hydratase/carnithine racemase